MCAYPTLLSEFTMSPSAGGNDGAAAEEDSSPRASPEVEAAAASSAAAADEDGKPVDLAAASGKIRLLRQLLPALQAGGHRVLLLSQSRKVCTIQGAWHATDCFGNGLMGNVGNVL